MNRPFCVQECHRVLSSPYSHPRREERHPLERRKATTQLGGTWAPDPVLCAAEACTLSRTSQQPVTPTCTSELGSQQTRGYY